MREKSNTELPNMLRYDGGKVSLDNEVLPAFRGRAISKIPGSVGSPNNEGGVVHDSRPCDEQPSLGRRVQHFLEVASTTTVFLSSTNETITGQTSRVN